MSGIAHGLASTLTSKTIDNKGLQEALAAGERDLRSIINMNRGEGFCGDLTGGRAAALLSGERYVRAARRVCLAEHCSGVGVRAGRGVGSDLAVAIRRPSGLLPRRVGFARLSLSRRKRRDCHQLTRGRLVFSAWALCSSAVQCGEGWSSGGTPGSDSRQR